MSKRALQIVTRHDPDEIVQYSAEQLQWYVNRLFQIDAAIVATGEGQSTAVILDAKQACVNLPDEKQAFILRRSSQAGSESIAAVGGSSTATIMWAVYDLVERWGVRYSVRGDILPASPGDFHLPDIDVVRKANLPFRGVRLINDFSMGLESWSLADIKRYIDQLAKLKFNSVYHHLWCWQPYVHYECRGVEKTTGVHWFNWHYRIDGDTIGRHHFGRNGEFVPPDFEGCRTYDERLAVGKHIVTESLAHAKRRGFATQICTVVTDFPGEFFHVLGKPPIAPHTFGLGVSGGHQGADSPAFQDMCAAALRAHIDTYPDVDSYIISMPEFHAEDTPYEAAWQRLDKKYGLSKVITLEQVLAQAGTRHDFPGGATRVVRAAKGDIVALDLFDRLLDEKKILDDCVKPDADIRFTGVSEELAEVYNQMRPRGIFTCSTFYTSSHAAQRPQTFERIRKAGVRPVLTMTSQDDNIGVLPQLSTASIHELLDLMRQYDWEGFGLRYWMITEMDPTVAYLSAVTWDESVTPESAYRDHARTVCGEPAQDDLVTCFKILDEITAALGVKGLGIGFPIPSMAVDHWYMGGQLSPDLTEARDEYARALNYARNARAQAVRGQDYADRLIGRLEFAIHYLDTVDTAKRAGQAHKDGARSTAVELLGRAVELAARTVTDYAEVTIDGTDLGTLAQLNEDFHRRLARFYQAVRTGKKWTQQTEVADSGILIG